MNKGYVLNEVFILFGRSVILATVGFLLWGVFERFTSGYVGLAVFILLLISMRWGQKRLTTAAALQRAFDAKPKEDTYPNPAHRPDPDKRSGGDVG